MPQQGTYTLDLTSADGHPLAFSGSGSPDKLLEFVVPFLKTFAAPPIVHIGVTGITNVGDGDTNWKPTQGFHIHTGNISAAQFTLQVQVSWYNKALKVDIAWLALEAT